MDSYDYSQRFSNNSRRPYAQSRPNQPNSVPAVSSRWERGQRRAFDFNQNRTTDWYEGSRDFEERPRKPIGSRSTNWKNEQNKKKASKRNEATPVSKNYFTGDDTRPETQSKDNLEEVNYEILTLCPAIPITSIYCQNFDNSGFITLLEQTYLSFFKLNPRLKKEMPFSVFQHAMTVKLNAILIDIKESGQNDIFTGQWAKDLFSDDSLVPGPIYDYFNYLADVILVSGVKVVVNVPDICIPRGPIIEGEKLIAPSGSFGYVTSHTHNVYEAYVSPLVTSYMVMNELREPGQPALPPLPLSLVPPDSIPTFDLLGYKDVHPCGSDARTKFSDIRFPNDNSLVGILKIDPQLEGHVNNTLKTLESQFIMKSFKECKQKNFMSNSCFIEADAIDNQPLRVSIPSVYSKDSFSNVVANIALMFGQHVRRKESSPGFCYTTRGGMPIPQWIEHINDNFNLAGPFSPVVFKDLPELRFERFRVCSPKGYRSNVVQSLVSRYIRKPAVRR